MTDTTQTNQHHKTELPTAWPGELKALLALGIPMALTQLAQFSIYTIDILMIGRLGPTELAAAALGTVVYFLLWMLGFGPVMAVSPLVSQALGADVADRDNVRISVRMALWTIVFMSPFMLVLVILTEPMAVLAGQDPAQSAKAGAYVLALAAGWPFALGTMVLRNFLAALGKTRIPLVLVLLSVALNAGLNALLIFGMFGFPEWGLVGAGIASSISYMVGFFLFVIYINWDKKSAPFLLFKNLFTPHWQRLREVVRLGWPISLTTVFEGMLFNACLLLVGLIGIIEIAAYQIALNVVALAFMLPWGLSMAGAIRVGLAKGAGNPMAVKRAGILTVITSVIGIMLFAVPIALMPETIAGLYMDAAKPDNVLVITLVASFLPIAAAFMFFDAVQVAANQILRGLKDVRWPMVATGISYWVIGFPAAAYLAFATPLGAKGVWYGLLLGLLSASILLSYRFWRLAWGVR
ncbi:MAG: MATE family efflux transporter [Robiginitomaculum sp.]|nr:MAG: MATE family efflux transporter [Robiginitomaculum sp.]